MLENLVSRPWGAWWPGLWHCGRPAVLAAMLAAACGLLVVPAQAAFAGSALPQHDRDGDGIADILDNCPLAFNPDQRDSNGNEIGNLCDGDLDGNGAVDATDLTILRARLGSRGADADLDGDGIVGPADEALLRGLIGKPLAGRTPVFSDNFETGIGDWSADNGVWEVGTPTSGPNACHQGSRCAATVLAGSYPGDTSSRLVSPVIVLPALTRRQELQLRFWAWYQYGACDGRYVQISTRDPVTGNWSAWTTLSGMSDLASTWSLNGADLTPYAGATVRLALYHTATSTTGCSSSGSGWYIDEFSVGVRTPRLDGTFDRGWGGWATDNGIWLVGTPSGGPQGCQAGAQCAATALDGGYPPDGYSRLVSPTFQVPVLSPGQEAQLRFWQWFSYGACDAGFVQVSRRDPSSGAWSAWTPVGTPTQLTSPWSPKSVDLTAFSGATLRVALYHSATSTTGCSSAGAGWTIDSLQLVVGTPSFGGTFEAGWGGWWADNGVWQVGTPTSGPLACRGGSQCAATVLDGPYPGESFSRLVSPTVTLPSIGVGQDVELRFWHWFEYGACDAGYVQVSQRDDATGSWSAWVTVGTPTAGVSSWTLKAVSLGAYAGSTVRLALYHAATATTGCSSSGAGWYVDDLSIVVP